MTVKDLIEHLQTKSPDDVIAYMFWQTDDVFTAAENRGIDITQEIAEEVLYDMEHYKDCENGMTWTVLETFLDAVLENEQPINEEEEVV